MLLVVIAGASIPISSPWLRLMQKGICNVNTWKCFDSLVCSCVGSQHVAQVLSCCSELGRLSWGKGAVDPATEAHNAWLIEGRPQFHLGAKLPAHNNTWIVNMNSVSMGY